MIRPTFRFLAVLLFIGLGLGSAAFSDTPVGVSSLTGDTQSDTSQLLGQWRSRSDIGTFSLNFTSRSQLVFEGESFAYTQLPGVIRINDGYETIDYGYRFQGSTLIIAFPEGYQLQFTRVGPPPTTSQGKSRSTTAPNRGRSTRSEGTRSGSGGTVKQASTSTVSAGEIGSVHWGFKGQPPVGWKFQQNQQGAVLGHDTIAGMIVVMPHLAASQNEVEASLRQGLVEEGTQLRLMGNLQAIGNGAWAGEYQGVYQGQQAKARGIGTYSSSGGGAFIIALTTPEMYGADLTGAAETLARNLQYFKVDVTELSSHFVGMWAHATANTLTNFELFADGTFTSTYEAGYSGKFQNDLGHQTGNWGVAGQEGNRGRWTIRGTKEQGALILTWPNGEQEMIEYHVHRERGQTYWSEYRFDGTLYSKRRGSAPWILVQNSGGRTLQPNYNSNAGTV
ncbi:MAG: hypothetical protein WBB73_04480 [Candidatus Aminicenantaceae bacterium]